MKNYLAYLFLTLLVFTSCTNKEDIGDVLIGGDELPGSYTIDSSTVISYSFRLDSFSTEGLDSVVVGAVSDVVFGDLYAAFVGQLALPSSNFKFVDSSESGVSVILDSVVFDIQLLQTIGNQDTQVFHIVRIEESLLSGSLYNTTPFRVKDTLGSFQISDSAISVFRTLLNIDSGSVLRNFFESVGDYGIANQDIFNSSFGAIAILSDTTTEFGSRFYVLDPFEAGRGLAFHYRKVIVDTLIDSVSTLSSDNELFQFSSISTTPTYSYYKSLSVALENFYSSIDTTIGSDTIYLNSIFNHHASIKLPYINSLVGKNIVHAELLLPIIDGLADNDIIQSGTVNVNNVELVNSSGNPVLSSGLTGFERYELDGKRYYRANVTERILRMMDSTISFDTDLHIFLNKNVPQGAVLLGNENIKLNLVIAELN